MYSVTIQEIKDEFELVNLTDEIDLKTIEIESPEVNRPALQLAGFFDYFDSERVQLMGIVEYTYLCKLTPEFRQETLEKLFHYKMPCVIMCRDLDPSGNALLCKTEGVPIIKTKKTTSEYYGRTFKWMKTPPPTKNSSVTIFFMPSP